MRPTSTLALLLLFQAVGAPSSAQAPEVARLRSLFDGLSRATRVEITAPGLWIQDGRLEGVVGDSVRVAENGLVVPVAFDEIETVAVESNRMWIGALTGAAGGALVGSAFGMMVGSYGCPNLAECNRDGRRFALQGALVVGAVGAVAGGLFGRTLVRWQPVFP